MSEPRGFRLHLRDKEQDVQRTVKAETFFAARAKLAHELGVDPGEIRLAAPHDSKAGG